MTTFVNDKKNLGGAVEKAFARAFLVDQIMTFASNLRRNKQDMVLLHLAELTKTLAPETGYYVEIAGSVPNQ